MAKGTKKTPGKGTGPKEKVRRNPGTEKGNPGRPEEPKPTQQMTPLEAAKPISRPTLAFTLEDGQLIPHEHPCLADKKFAGEGEAVAAIIDYIRDNANNPEAKRPECVVLLQILNY